MQVDFGTFGRETAPRAALDVPPKQRSYRQVQTLSTLARATMSQAPEPPGPSAAASFLPDALRQLSALSAAEPAGLLAASDRLLAQVRTQLRVAPQCMLPSYTRALPTGEERGAAVAVDLGGSTLRVAAVELRGRAAPGARLRVVARGDCRVGAAVKALPGPAFFDWIAERVGRVLADGGMGDGAGRAVGVTWSFPIE